MQRIINNPAEVVDDMLEGFISAHRNIVVQTDNKRVLKYKDAPIKNKVGVVTGGGSGHKPAFIGYIGRNMVDAVAVGEIFSSPPAQMFLDAFRAVDGGSGVACLYGNYMGDNMNVKIASKLAAEKGLQVKTVVANDDVASAPKGREAQRRGGAGEIFMWKVGGAAAATGKNLDEVIKAAQSAIDNTRSVGIGLSPCTIPEVGHPNFSIADGTMELGIGHHGEPGREITSLGNAAEIASKMVNIVLPDLPFSENDEVACIVSGLGATPVMELYILFSQIEKLINLKKIKIYKSYVGNYFTSLEMMGATLTLMKLDKTLKSYLDMDAKSVGLTQFKTPDEMNK